jgi:cytochrome P450
MYTASTNSNRRDKWEWQTKGMAIPASTLAAAPHALHRRRRGALNPFFSMQNVRKLLPFVEERVEALVGRLRMCGTTGEVVKLEYAMSAFTNGTLPKFP